MTKDYQSHTTAGDFESSREEQNIDGAMKVITSATLSGVMIVDHWEFPERGEYYSLARLDLNRFAENLSRYKELSKEVVNSVRQRAKRLHEEMSREIDKLSGARTSSLGQGFVIEENDITEVHPEDEEVY